MGSNEVEMGLCARTCADIVLRCGSRRGPIRSLSHMGAGLMKRGLGEQAAVTRVMFKFLVYQCQAYTFSFVGQCQTCQSAFPGSSQIELTCPVSSLFSLPVGALYPLPMFVSETWARRGEVVPMIGPSKSDTPKRRILNF